MICIAELLGQLLDLFDVISTYFYTSISWDSLLVEFFLVCNLLYDQAKMK